MALDTSKIIHAPVGGGRYTVTSPIVKEDYGLHLLIEGLELPSTYEVDFSNSEHNGTSVTMIGNADGVLIPSQFISSGKDVFAFLYHVGDNYGRTVFKFRIPNKLRPDRTSEEPTPEEQSVIDQAINALNSAVEQTAQDVIDADASAQSASADADRAEEAKTDAQSYASSANTSSDAAYRSASSAQLFASQAETSAQTAEQIKDDVEGMVDDAQASASASAQSATASANSASQASGYAQSASASASSAQGYASQAQTSAQTASSKASEASQSASTASTKASESAQSASQALTYKTDAEQAKTSAQTAQTASESARDSAISAKNDAESARDDAETARDEAQSAVASISGALDEKAPIITDTASGSIASFSDGADNLPLKSLVVDINPVQDLHGQENPYPAGGGKNKLDVTSVTWKKWQLMSDTFKAREDDYSHISFTVSGDTISVESKGTYTGIGIVVDAVDVDRVFSVVGVSYFVGLYDSYADNATRIQMGKTSCLVPANTSGFIAIRFDTVGTFAVKVQLESGSTLTAWSPYENICPISGWAEVGVEQRGKNLANLSFSDNVPSIYTGEMVLHEGWSTDFIRVFQNCDYIASFQTQHTNYVLFYDANKTYLGYANPISGVYSPNSNAYWSQIAYVKLRSDGTENESTKAQLELSSTATDYEPYSGQSISIALGQTVYGGKLDVLSGELTIDRAMVDLGTLPWSYDANGTYPVFYSEGIKSNVKSPPEVITCASNVLKAISNRARTSLRSVADNNVVCITSSGNIGCIAIRNDTFTDTSSFKSWLNTNSVQLVYELATPIEIQLSANQLNSLYGVNNLWADSGDTEVEYRADTKLFIERLTAPDSADMIADANITSGKYFMVGNSLYKATANIANGSAIVVGTNCIRKSLSEALNEINA